MVNSSVQDLFLEMGYNWKEMKINSPVDVSQKQFYISSYDLSLGKKVQNLITKIVRKDDSIAFVLETETGEKLKTAGDHRYLISFENSKEKLHYLDCINLFRLKRDFYVLHSADKLVKATLNKTEEIIPILDFEVENVSNYFSEDVLSHNTMFGDPRVATGGNALKFYATVRIEFARGDLIKVGEEVVGSQVRFKFIKNKVAPPYTTGTVKFLYSKGFDVVGGYLDAAVDKGIVKRSGAWFSYGEEKIGQGRDNASAFLESSPEIFKEIKGKLNALKSVKVTAPEIQEEKGSAPEPVQVTEGESKTT